MNIAFVNTPFKEEYGKFSRTSRSPAVTKTGTCYYPFWLAQAAAVADEDKGFNVTLIDCTAAGDSKDDLLVKLKGFNPDLLVLDTTTPSIYSDLDVAKKVKAQHPDCFIVLVGTHVSALPVETVKLSTNVDAAAFKEYDFTICDLGHALKDGKPVSDIYGIAYRDEKGEVQKNPERLPIEDLDALPFVSKAYKKWLNVKNYYFGAAQYPLVMLVSGRGCPNYCDFCVYPQTMFERKYRYRSAENLADEFQWISENMPEVKEIGLEDDTFTIYEKRVREFCDILIERGLHKKLKWYPNVRVSLTLETMKKMRSAGCRLLVAGFESGNQQILKNIKKGTMVKQIKSFVENANKADLLIHGCFIAGLRGETKETLEETLQFAKTLNVDTLQFFPMQVYPGTDAYTWAEKDNVITTKDFSKWVTEDGSYNAVVNLGNGLTPEYLQQWSNRAFREYHFRPSYMLMKLQTIIKHPDEIQRNWRSFKSFFQTIILNPSKAPKMVDERNLPSSVQLPSLTTEKHVAKITIEPTN